jgi:hypothetical protein
VLQIAVRFPPSEDEPGSIARGARRIGRGRGRVS